MSLSLVYTTIVRGSIPVRIPKTLAVLFAFHLGNMLHALLFVPLLHNWTIRPGLALGLILYYAVFQVVYVLTDTGLWL